MDDIHIYWNYYCKVFSILIIDKTANFKFVRYYKFIFPDIRFLDLKIWFVIHRPLMFTGYLLTLIGFFVIFADQNWKWIDKKSKISFVHSLFGIILIILTLIQVNLINYITSFGNTYFY